MTDEIPERVLDEVVEIVSWAQGGGFEGQTEDDQMQFVARALLAAERRGREEALEEAALHLLTKVGVGASVRECAAAIRALPLPGAAPHAALGLERTPTEREEGREGKP